MLAGDPSGKDPVMSSPVPPGQQPDQGFSETTPDQGITEQQPQQGLDKTHPTPAPETAATKSKAPLFVGIGALVVVVIGIIAAIIR